MTWENNSLMHFDVYFFIWSLSSTFILILFLFCFFNNTLLKKMKFDWLEKIATLTWMFNPQFNDDNCRIFFCRIPCYLSKIDNCIIKEGWYGSFDTGFFFDFMPCTHVLLRKETFIIVCHCIVYFYYMIIFLFSLIIQ